MNLVVSAIYSDNLGDGVLALSTEHLLHQAADTPVFHLDISGRDGWETHQGEHAERTKPSLIKQFFYCLPSWLRYFATLAGWFLIFRPRLKRQMDKIDGRSVDHLVVAGGQLISDIYWNFPLKLSFIISWAQRSNIRVSFLAVGVSSDFSFVGRRLLAKALSSEVVTLVGVRDHLSLTNLENNFSAKGIVIPDAGLWAMECFDRNLATKDVIGLGISSPDELGLHASLGVDIEAYKLFWHDLTSHLVLKGYEIALFTNGSADDEAYKDALFSELIRDERFSASVSNMKRPLVPQELCSLIGSFCGVISHRLHANIIANSYCIPSIGLKWDKKLDSYFKLIGKEARCLDMSSSIVVVNELERAMKEAVDKKSIDSLKNRTLIQVEAIARGEI